MHSKTVSQVLILFLFTGLLSACGSISDEDVKEIETHIQVMKDKESLLKDKNLGRLEEYVTKAEADTMMDRSESVAKLKEVSAKTGEMLTLIDDIGNRLIEKSGGWTEETGFVAPRNRDAVKEFMIGSAKNGEAYKMKKNLDSFTDQMNDYARGTGLKFGYIENLPVSWVPAEGEAKQEKVDFGGKHFKGKTVIESLEKLGELKLIVLDMEAKIQKKHID